MSYTSILVISDNQAIVTDFIDLLTERPELVEGRKFQFACHYKNENLANKTISDYTVSPLNVADECKQIVADHDLVISAHCKQIFPSELVSQIKCINIHPGYNPYNRGWYPQVFSILNGKPLGATIHEIDEELDHGGIIDQEMVAIESGDTSKTAYDKVQQKEFELLRRNLAQILDGTYEVRTPESEGNINLKKDFEHLRELDLNEQVTLGEALDRLRALTHPPFKNAYFIDPKTQKRVWVELSLQEEEIDE